MAHFIYFEPEIRFDQKKNLYYEHYFNYHKIKMNITLSHSFYKGIYWVIAHETYHLYQFLNKKYTKKDKEKFMKIWFGQDILMKERQIDLLIKCI